MAITYKGYAGHVESREHAGVICGEVLGLSDVICFQSSTFEDLEAAFRDAIDNYLTLCHECGCEPERQSLAA